MRREVRQAASPVAHAASAAVCEDDQHVFGSPPLKRLPGFSLKALL
jgi:hypothetical protein